MKRLCMLALCAIATGVAFGSVLMDETISSLSPIVEPDWKRVLMARVAEAGRLGLFEEKRRERLAEITRRAERAPDSRLPAARECATRRITLLAAERMQELHARRPLRTFAARTCSSTRETPVSAGARGRFSRRATRPASS